MPDTSFDWSKYPTIPAQTGNNVSAPQAQPFDWSKYPTLPTPLSSQIASYPVAALSGIASGTRDIGNLLGKGINYLSSSLFHKNIVPELPAVNLSQVMGLPQHPLISQLSSILPSLAAGEAAVPAEMGSLGVSMLPKISRSVAAQAAGTGLYGGAEAAKRGVPIPQLPKEMVINALIGGLLGKGGEMGAQLFKPLGQALSKHLVEPLTEKAEEFFRPSEEISRGQPLAGALESTREKAKEWTTQLIPMAAQADKADKSFSNKEYIKKATSLLDELHGKEGEDPSFYLPLIDSVADKIKRAPTSYKSALEQNAAINRMPSTWELTNQPVANMLRHYSGELGNALKDQVDMNAANSPKAQEFANMWKEQRTNYQKLKSFQQTPVAQRQGGFALKFSKPQAQAITGGETPTEDSLKYFLPTARDKTTLKMEHFGKLIGNEPLGKEILKQEYLSPAYEQGEFDAKKALMLYRKLGTSQRTYLFSRQEQQLMNKALKAKTISAKRSTLGRLTRYGTLPGTGAILGGLYGHERGRSPLQSAGTGAVAGALLPELAPLIGRLFSTPRASNFIMKMARQGVPSKIFSYPAIGSVLSDRNQ